MAIQSNQPSRSWVLVDPRCPWSRLMKSRGIVHPGEGEPWGLFCGASLWDVLKKFWGFWRGVGLKNGELQPSGKLFFVFQGTVYGSLMYFLFMYRLFLKIPLLSVMHPLGWDVYIILYAYIIKMPFFVFTVIYVKFSEAQCMCFPPCCRHVVVEKECRNECIDLCLSLSDRSRWGSGSSSLADGLY